MRLACAYAIDDGPRELRIVPSFFQAVYLNSYRPGLMPLEKSLGCRAMAGGGRQGRITNLPE